MIKGICPNISVESTNGTVGCLPGGCAPMAIGIYPPAANIEAAITQALENNVKWLESLRDDIGGAQRRHEIADVRSFGNTMAASLLVGIEDHIAYDDLVKLIAQMRTGIARRRLALEA